MTPIVLTWLTAGLVAVASTPIAAQGAPVIRAGTAFPCTPVAVWDGDGPVWCAEGPKLRLAGIAAREIDGTCRTGQPCPAASGLDARRQLVALLGGPKGVLREGHIAVAGPVLRCTSEGGGKGDRTAARCLLPGGADLSCEMIASGTALRWPNYDRADRCRPASARWPR